MASPIAPPPRRGPLEGRALPAGPGFALAIAPPAARFILRGDAEVAEAAGAAFGLAIPRASGAASAREGRAALWLGPDEWLLIAEGEDGASLARALGAALADRPHSLVDVSQRQIGLEASGPLARRALTAGCPLDLRDGAFPDGAATRTMLAKSEIVLWRRAPARYRIEVWRSFADYAASFLEEAAKRAPPI
ncbi:MAG: sarcosine oxidase subunit gamma [Rhizobiales bacterium]|nr:sarcosine oxidase subunit gamma [Hyphomicrobiales bacterium]